MAHLFPYATVDLTPLSNIESPKISFTAKDIDFLKWKGDLLALVVTEEDVAQDENLKFANPLLKQLDSYLGGLLAEALSEEDFTGKTGQSKIVRSLGFEYQEVGLFGLGPCSPSSPPAYRSLGETVAAAVKTAQAEDVAIVLASSEGLFDEFKICPASAIASGIVLGIYEDNRFKSESEKLALKYVDFLGRAAGPEMQKKLEVAELVCSGVIFGKELVNAPANVLTPAVLAEEASKIAAAYSDVLSAKILDVEQCKELKMGSFLGVASASANPLHFIHLCYKPLNGPIKAKMGLVGKGLTFDSGNNIKTGPGSSIELMKSDMGGSAAVLGAAKAIGQIKPPGVEVHFIVASCEKTKSGTGMRPGDFIKTLTEKTIEVTDTDAEGGLLFAEALLYACNQGAEKIVNLGTLTGSSIAALGPSIAGALKPSDGLAKEILSAAEGAGEKLWRMPMDVGYWESMKSGAADMIHSGIAIAESLFLNQFGDGKVQWTHIDVAGPVFDDKGVVGTGFGITTLVEWVLKNSS